MDKDIEHYLENPDQIPEDMGALQALLEAADGTADADTSNDKSDVTEAPSSPSAQEVEKETEETPAPIASKDGKHTIPYAVLASEREKRVAAERMLQDLTQRMQDIESKVAAGKSVEVEQSEMAEIVSEEGTQDLLADFPALKPLVEYTKQLEARVSQFQERFTQVERVELQRQQQLVEQQAASVRTEVDANPHLRYWESADPDRWQAALAADEQLRHLPVNKNLSMRDRFEKVVQVVEAIYGPTDFPEGFKPKADTKTMTEKVRKAVEAAEPIQPRTIGEMPGGTPPRGDELEEILSRSPQELGARLATMTTDQINNLLNRLG